MQTLSEFWRGYAPAHAEHCDPRTHAEYQTTIKLAVEILDDPPIDHVNLLGSVFVRDAIKRGLSSATVAKHCRHLNAVFAAMQTTLGYKPSWQLPTVQKHDPKIVTDFNSFASPLSLRCIFQTIAAPIDATSRRFTINDKNRCTIEIHFRCGLHHRQHLVEMACTVFRGSAHRTPKTFGGFEVHLNEGIVGVDSKLSGPIIVI